MNPSNVGDVLIRKAPVRKPKSISITDALTSITDKAISRAIEAYDSCDNSIKLSPTTIRLPNNVSEFYSVLADELGISFQSAMVVSLTGLIESSRPIHNPGETLTQDIE